MIIITEQSETHLVSWYENAHFGAEDEHPPRAFYIKAFDALYDGKREQLAPEVAAYLTPLLTHGDIRLYRCHDDDIIIVGTDIASAQISEALHYFVLDLERSPRDAVMYVMGENWDQFRDLSYAKLAKARSLAKETSYPKKTSQSSNAEPNLVA